MRHLTKAFFLLFFLLLSQGTVPRAAQTTTATADPAQFVNPYVGSTGIDMANTFPGATLRFGMIQWSPDTAQGFDKTHQGSYIWEDHAIRGFSLTHLSGTGCPAMGDVLITPVAGAIKTSPAADPLLYAAKFSHADEEISPGYYSVALGNGVKVQLAVTARAGLGRFAFPDSRYSSLLFNVGRDATGVKTGSIEISGDRRISGSVSGGGFCGSKQDHYTVYFAAEFNRAFTSYGTWKGGVVNQQARRVAGVETGGFVEFDTASGQPLEMKVGLSYVSAVKARKNLESEIPGWDVDAVRAAGRKRWNHDLGLITVSGGTEGEKQTFYTALYHALLHPNVFNDVDGEYIGFDRQIHVAKGFNVYANFSGWDIYRSEVQLLAMLFPKETSDMVTSLVLDAQQGGGGGLPIWPIANNEACTMVGSPASPIIAGAYAFGARTFDAHSALAAMLRGATDANARSGSCPESDNLDDYLKYGYLGPESLRPDKRSSGPSQTLESATADFSIAQLAQALGDSNTYRTFMKRAQFWRNTFDTETGYIAPRRKDGSFIRVGPADNKYYVEGNAEQYSWGVPYNMRALLDLMGGNAKVVARLDKFFTELNAFETKPYCWIGNEPSFAIPWAYDFALAPWTTQAVTRRIELEWFPPTPEGLPGNDDLGATSTWYVFAALGAYPAIPAVGGLALNSPVFPAAVIHLGNGKSIKIEAENASAPNPYVQTLLVNGKPYEKTWLSYDLLSRGATLHFTLGNTANKNWGTKPEDAPPSFADGR